MLIKICGIRKEEEILFLNKLKPDYIGLVFAESKRKISIEEGKILLSLLAPSITPIAVFRNNSLEYVKEVTKALNLKIVQLHGNEGLDFQLALKNSGLKLWRGICINGESDAEDLSLFEKVIYDNLIPGSGEELNLEGLSPKRDFILSGGLTVENVCKKLSLKNLIGVDVASGVESVILGERSKDYKKCKEFIERVRNYEDWKI